MRVTRKQLTEIEQRLQRIQPDRTRIAESWAEEHIEDILLMLVGEHSDMARLCAEVQRLRRITA